jgi:hypothetical protein
MSGPKLKVKLSHETPTKSRAELNKQRKKELKDYLESKKRVEKYKKSGNPLLDIKDFKSGGLARRGYGKSRR